MPVGIQDGEPWSVTWEPDLNFDEVKDIEKPPAYPQPARYNDLSMQPRGSIQDIDRDPERDVNADNIDDSHLSKLTLKDLFASPAENDKDEDLLDEFLSKGIPPVTRPQTSVNLHKGRKDKVKDTISPSVVDSEAVLQNMLDILYER